MPRTAEASRSRQILCHGHPGHDRARGTVNGDSHLVIPDSKGGGGERGSGTLFFREGPLFNRVIYL